MDWLNYHHLLYFWAVSKTGSVTRASQELRLAQPTISAQVRALDGRLEAAELHRRQVRGLFPGERHPLVGVRIRLPVGIQVAIVHLRGRIGGLSAILSLSKVGLSQSQVRAARTVRPAARRASVTFAR